MHYRLTRIPSNRAAFAVAGLLCFIAAAVLMPSGARSQNIAAGEATPAALETHIVPAAAPVAPQRDAFAPRAVDEDVAIAPRTSILPAAPQPAGRTAIRERASTVSAIATGDSPSALIESDGSTRIVSVGDVIGSAHVAAIDAGGVLLSTGRRMQLTAGTP